MPGQPPRTGDLEPKPRKIALARTMRTDTDGNTSAAPGIMLGPADCRVLLQETKGLRALVRRLYRPGSPEPGETDVCARSR